MENIEQETEDLDFLDPRNWKIDTTECRIYADDYANEWAIVDQVDYQYLIEWRWKPGRSRVSKGTAKPKVYLCRAVPTIVGKDTYENGKRIQNRVTSTLYLHQAVMERKGDRRPKTDKKLIIDHANGNGMDCRRKNLRWATISFNNKNLFGSHERTFFDEEL